ncbi:MAG: serine/threonine-protein kinase [Acidobacteriota bacterium]
METSGRTKLKEIFEAVVDLPVSERSRSLADKCAGDDNMRARIEQLLAADDAAGSFLESSPFEPSVTSFAEVRSQKYVGQTIGPYHVERVIGSGGMGTVFLATRDPGELDQTVAIKIVHEGAHSNEIIRRFLIERRILATLEHSGIARLIDVGQTGDGLPYLVMEYVAGEPLDEYCRNSNLSLDDRLRIFRNVCSAVAYAHRHLIIHRDLKPSNILVTSAGEAKLLDFGIAKLLTVDADTPQTATMMNLLTPAYAAPEQVRGEAVTTATDVYGLGVILYELLAGVRPFSFDDKNYQDIVRAICDTEPPKPSEAHTLNRKTSETGEKEKPVTPGHRRDSFKFSIDRTLRGDLDNIVLKALRKDPERRYQSVEQFSEDIERFQKGLPVSARPDTFAYRATKFVQRNRFPVAMSALILLLLIGGIIGTTWQAARAAQQQKIAEQRFAQVRELANNVIFKYHDSIANLNGSTEVRKMLAEDATKYLDSLSQDAGADENLRNELALAYAKLADVQGKPYYANTGDSAGALENYQKSIKLLEGLVESKDPAIKGRAVDELIPTYHSYSSLCSRAFNFEAAVASQAKALDLAQKQLDLDPQDLKKRIAFARANLWLGDAVNENGNFSEAMERYRLFLGLADDIYNGSPGDKDAMTLLGVAHDRIGRMSMLRGQELARTDYSPDKIADIFRDSYTHLAKTAELFAKVAAAEPGNQKYVRNVSAAETNLGQSLRNIGDLGGAFEKLQMAVESDEANILSDSGNRQLKADHVSHLAELAMTLAAGNEPAKAVQKLRSAKQMIGELIAADADNMEFHRIQLEIVDDLGGLLVKSGDASGALEIFQNALDQPFASGNVSDETFAFYAKGLLSQDIGDCYATMAKAGAISPKAQKEYRERSAHFYGSAADLWQSPGVQDRYLSRTPEMFEYLKRKLSSRT